MPNKPTRGRPRQNPKLRQQQILSAAVKLFAHKGYHQTDLQEVARNLDIAKGTIYLYFPTKNDLFLAAVEYAVEKLAGHIDKAVQTATTPTDKVKAIVSAYFSFFNKESLLAEIITLGRHEALSHAEQTYYRVVSKNVKHIETILQSGIQDGSFRNMNPRSFANILANLLHGTIYINVLGKRKIHTKKTIESTTDFLLQGILK